MNAHTRSHISLYCCSLKYFHFRKSLMYSMCLEKTCIYGASHVFLRSYTSHCSWKGTHIKYRFLGGLTDAFILFHFLLPHTLFAYISACLREIWTYFTQLTCSDTALVRVSNCSSVEHDASVKHAFSFSLSTMILCIFSPCICTSLPLSINLSPFSPLIFHHFSPFSFYL